MVTMPHDVLSLFLQGPSVIFRWRNLATWPMEYVSPNVEQILGYTDTELLSGHIAYADLIHRDDVERVEQEVAAFQNRKYFYHDPYRLRRKDGRNIWVSDHTRTVTQGGEITHFLGYVTNITKQIDAQQQVCEERRLLQTLIDLLPDYIYIKDTDGRFLLNNRACLAALGVTEQAETLGKTDADFFPLQAAARYAEAERRVLNGEPMIDQEEFNDGPNGGHWISSSKVPLRDASGDIIGLVGIGHDISRLRSAQAQLEQTQEKLRTAIRILSETERREIAIKKHSDKVTPYGS